MFAIKFTNTTLLDFKLNVTKFAIFQNNIKINENFNPL